MRCDSHVAQYAHWRRRTVTAGEPTGVRLAGPRAAGGQLARFVEIAPRVHLVACAALDRERVASSALASATRTARTSSGEAFEE